MDSFSDTFFAHYDQNGVCTFAGTIEAEDGSSVYGMDVAVTGAGQEYLVGNQYDEESEESVGFLTKFEPDELSSLDDSFPRFSDHHDSPVDESAPPATSEYVFPHLVDGGGYTTQVILFSGAAGQASTGRVVFLSQTGQPLPITFGSEAGALAAISTAPGRHEFSVLADRVRRWLRDYVPSGVAGAFRRL